ncbi:MAG: metallophosphoesterase [Anaerolineae bacterium]|nr:metallophosphoesterase [Anaerolineae bacterium]
MKILTVSDNVLGQLENATNLLRIYGDSRAIISCGDMPAHYLEYITSVLSVPLFFVRGNHDEAYTEGSPGGDNLHQRLVYFRGLSIAGLEGSIRYNRGIIQYTDSQMFRMVLGLGPKVLIHRLRHGTNLDLMVTHAPPFGIHDQTDRPHIGFKSFNLLIRLYSPRYLIHGHVDVLDRRKPTQTLVKNTQVININPVKALDIEKVERSAR